MKRQRSDASLSASSERSPSRSPSSAPSPTAKHSRPDPSSLSVSNHLTCSLGPTCDTKPQVFLNEAALQNHYQRCHSHVCRDDGGCEKIFPEERLLELHIAENHDPIAKVRQTQGEKIFECFLPTSACTKAYSTPKDRRNHLIQAHHYPKEYFFSITNHGIGDLIERFGHGATLYRPAWKARETRATNGADGNGVEKQKLQDGLEETVDGKQSTTAEQTGGLIAHEDQDETMYHSGDGSHRKPSKKSAARLASPPAGSGPVPAADSDSSERLASAIDVDMSALIGSMASTSLDFVPKSVRSKAKTKQDKGIVSPPDSGGANMDTA